jgi:hypothetical protein
MELRNWSKSEFEYGRQVLNSGLEGARSGREAFLSGRSLTPFLSHAARKALKPAIVGALVGVLSGYRPKGHGSITRMLGFGFLGSLFGFASGIAWESRDLTSSMAANAKRSIDKVRDEHWLQKHPIDYA